MTYKEIQDLIKLINKSNLTEFKLKDGDFELSIRTKKYGKARTQQMLQSPQQIVPLSSPAMPMNPSSFAPPASAPSPDPEPLAENGKEDLEEVKESKKYVEIKSPIVGTFYRSPAPDKAPYVKVGDVVEVGSVVCIVEAMKLFNEIESEVSGKVVKVMVEDATPVEYDQVLFLADPGT